MLKKGHTQFWAIFLRDSQNICYWFLRNFFQITFIIFYRFFDFFKGLLVFFLNWRNIFLKDFLLSFFKEYFFKKFLNSVLIFKENFLVRTFRTTTNEEFYLQTFKGKIRFFQRLYYLQRTLREWKVIFWEYFFKDLQRNKLKI